MATPRRITATTGTIPQSTSISGSVTVQSNTAFLTYTGSVDLSDYITDGNSGGAMSYVYIVCADTTSKIAKVTGAVRLTDTTWSIFTDGNMTGASSSTFSLITTPFYGYSYINDGGATVTVNGVNVLDGEADNYPKPDFADGLNIGNTIKPLYVVATSSSVLITNEYIGAPATA